MCLSVRHGEWDEPLVCTLKARSQDEDLRYVECSEVPRLCPPGSQNAMNRTGNFDIVSIKAICRRNPRWRDYVRLYIDFAPECWFALFLSSSHALSLHGSFGTNRSAPRGARLCMLLFWPVLSISIPARSGSFCCHTNSRITTERARIRQLQGAVFRKKSRRGGFRLQACGSPP